MKVGDHLLREAPPVREENDERPWHGVAGICVLITAFGLGLSIGGTHHGQTLVPVDKGTPADLPRWACNEIVDLRMQKLQMFDEYVKLAEGGKPVTFLHFQEGKLSVCR